jgi:hypothetical protein
VLETATEVLGAEQLEGGARRATDANEGGGELIRSECEWTKTVNQMMKSMDYLLRS